MDIKNLTRAVKLFPYNNKEGQRVTFLTVNPGETKVDVQNVNIDHPVVEAWKLNHEIEINGEDTSKEDRTEEDAKVAEEQKKYSPAVGRGNKQPAQPEAGKAQP